MLSKHNQFVIGLAQVPAFFNFSKEPVRGLATATGMKMSFLRHSQEGAASITIAVTPLPNN